MKKFQETEINTFFPNVVSSSTEGISDKITTPFDFELDKNETVNLNIVMFVA